MQSVRAHVPQTNNGSFSAENLLNLLVLCGFSGEVDQHRLEFGLHADDVQHDPI